MTGEESVLQNHWNQQQQKTGEDSADKKAEVSWCTLPDNVIENILCRVPFPEVLKARMLNKEWRSGFPTLITAYQVSANWPTYCPAFLSYGELLGFNRFTNQWYTMRFATLQHEGMDSIEPNGFQCIYSQAITGALLCILNLRFPGNQAALTVVNVFTGRRKVILCPSVVKDPWYRIAHPPLLNLVEDGGFKILLRDSETLDTMVYESRSDAWTNLPYGGKFLYRINLDDDDNDVRVGHAYLDGTLYWYEALDMDEDEDEFLVRIFIEDCFEETTASDDESEIDLDVVYNEWSSDYLDLLIQFDPAEKAFLDGLSISALRCGRKTVLVLSLYYFQLRPSEGQWSARVKVLEVDKNPKELGFSLIELSTATLSPGIYDKRVVLQADDDCIYICGENLTSYSLVLDKWTNHGTVPAGAYSRGIFFKQCMRFDPGLNPFMNP